MDAQPLEPPAPAPATYTERRHDDDTRLLIEQAIHFKETLGRAAAVAFLVEHHVPPPVLQRVMMQPAELKA